MSLFDLLSKEEKVCAALTREDVLNTAKFLSQLGPPSTTTVAKLILEYKMQDKDRNVVFGSILYDGIRRNPDINGYTVDIEKLPKRLQRILHIYQSKKLEQQKRCARE